MAARHHDRSHAPHPSAFHQGAQHGMGAVAGVVLLGGVLLGVGIFGLMVLLGAPQFKLIGAVAIGGLLSASPENWRNFWRQAVSHLS